MNGEISCAKILAAAALACIGALPAAADPVSDFYAGRSVTMLIPTSPGGDVDTRARLLARYMGKHIPGQPMMVPRNMPGAVGLQAANWLYNIAPKDGTVVHAVMQSMPTHQMLDGQGVQFDASRFNWIGNTSDEPNTVVAWAATGVSSIDQVKSREVVIGAPGTFTNCVYYPLLMNALVGTHFKIISGYPGGTEVNLAMERGEVAARGCQAWSAWASTKPDWLAEHKINILVQVALKRNAELPNVPLLMELGKDEADRQVLRFMSLDNSYGRPFATTPDTPEDRVNALRRAFDQSMQDPGLLTDAAKADIKLTPSTGEEVQRLVADVIATPRDVVERTKAILAEAARVERVK
jgi:tripartite-type tricarboxylate transporter receptor subunit TctC